MIVRFLICMMLLGLPGCIMWDTGPDHAFLKDHETPPQRLNNRSPWCSLDGQQVGLYVNFCGWDAQHEQRITHLPIGEKAKQMVMDADEMIVATFFLFDNLYADEPDGDYVAEFASLLIEKKQHHPSMPIVLILDLFHKGWGHRRSEIIDRLRAAGVDVFYSDLLGTRSAWRSGIWESIHEAGRAADKATGGLWSIPWDAFGRIPIPVPLDGEMCSVSTIANATLLKANHRKALITKSHGTYEVLTTSWNPHNPSLLHENHGLSVTGPLACYMYMVLREDVRKSIELGHGFVGWSNDSPQYHRDFLQKQLPPLPESAWHPAPATTANNPPGPAPPEAAIATEEAIEPILMQWLQDVGPDDEVRIQMFYLGRVPVVNAILDAAKRTRHPIRILLDPNRVGIDYPRDGTPNAPVADYLLERARIEHAKIEIRWYATHGEQNHAKAVTITNAATGKYQLSLGSANWTRKNLGGINLENNVFVRNSPELNRQFDEEFDRLWFNTDDGVEYSVAWDDPRYNYNRSPGRDHWAVQRKHFFFWPKFEPDGRPQLLEQDFVHW